MLDLNLYEDKEDVYDVIKELTTACTSCRLGHIQKSKGLVWRGNPSAKIALISIMPGPHEVESGKALSGGSGREGDKWFKFIGLDTEKDMWVCNVIQCKPPDVTKKDETSQREPEVDELAACFPNRCLRVLQSMPYLEVIITMGWSAARCFLGGNAGEKTHAGNWYETTLLPQIPIFCLPHPAGLLRQPSMEKEGKVIEYMKCFQREYDKVVGMVKK